MPSDDLTPIEREVLEECAGARPARPWGAALGVCLSFLQSSGYISRDGTLTEKGRAALTSAEPVEAGDKGGADVSDNETAEAVRSALRKANFELAVAQACIAELEAERDRLREALKKAVVDIDEAEFGEGYSFNLPIRCRRPPPRRSREGRLTMAIIIDGKTISFSGGDLRIMGDGRVFVDGALQEGSVHGVVEVRITEGSPVSVSSDRNVYCGDVTGDVTAEMSVECGGVGGNVKAGMSITCGDVKGSIDAGMGVSYRGR